MSRSDNLSVAVLLPCYNEALTIGSVVEDFRRALPQATIYVYDNNSTDGTAEKARQAGAVVRAEHGQGKGHVVRRMFADIEADIYLMVDGDATYHAPSAPALIAALIGGRHDMVNGARVERAEAAYRPGHRFGNRLLTGLVARIFGTATTDMLSGYKVFSRRFAKSFPAHARGFEIETELMIHALELRMSIGEVATPYAERPEGSVSKLRTLRDGFRILSIIGLFVKEERPLQFFAAASGLLALLAILLGVPLAVEFARTGLVPRLPTAVLACGIMLSAVMALFTGLVLDTVTRGRREMKRIAYLAVPALGERRQSPRQVRAAGGQGAILDRAKVEEELARLGQLWSEALKKSA